MPGGVITSSREHPTTETDADRGMGTLTSRTLDNLLLSMERQCEAIIALKRRHTHTHTKEHLLVVLPLRLLNRQSCLMIYKFNNAFFV
ncbi:hypothetical protein TNCV_1442981 [Trichonephila clavipes]|nr:hypothetical protein TNCV_1442981 [Trichonephila clavipes]